MARRASKLRAAIAGCVTVAVACSLGAMAASRGRVQVASADVHPSSFGSGAFGRWGADRFGLPEYDYTAAPSVDGPRQAGGGSEILHQVGNDHVVADAADDGSVVLWSQDHRYQWANHDDPSAGHDAGGYGYLRVGDHVVAARPGGGAQVARRFGVGYAEKELRAGGLDVTERTYAPFGDDPVLLDDVVVTNDSSTGQHASWFEYWDVNPYDQTLGLARGTAAPVWDPSRRTVTVAQAVEGGDTRPLSIYAAALSGPFGGFDTTTTAFFGAGGPARPSAVVDDRATGSIAPPSSNGTTGAALVAFRAPLSIAPHSTLVLRYAYGIAEPAAIPGIVGRYRARPNAFAASERAWSAWVPRVHVAGTPWLGRELAWDAYMLRSGTTYEACAGEHMISQGGYYQYAGGTQVAYRDPLQFALPMVYTDPSIARDIILYSAREQAPDGVTPYGTGPLCQRLQPGVTDDNDIWLLLAAAEYGLATHDLGLFTRAVPYVDGSTAPLWSHLALAFRHQESLVGPHGDYVSEASGDWSDASTTLLHMTESTMVTAQAAAVYPLFAELARARGDRAFAAVVDRAAARARQVVAAEWTGLGWYGRGWSGTAQIGTGALFEEPQPWALLADVPDADRTRTLIANIRRFLTGVGAPAALHGPSRIGSSQSPARNDPDVTERTDPPIGVGDNNAVWVGGTWYSLNGMLVWALTHVPDSTPGASGDAFDEFLRNTLAAHANAYPDQWDGIISVDDVCQSFYSTHAGTCGAGLTTAYQGQIMHQPAWSLFDTIALSGITPTSDGFRIDPRWPVSSFAVELPTIGVIRSGRTLRGYVAAAKPRRVRLVVTMPEAAGSRLRVRDREGSVPFERHGREITFSIAARAGNHADWSITW